MKRSLVRTLTLAGVGLTIIGVVVLLAGFSGGTTTTDASTGVTTFTAGNPGLAALSSLFFVVGGILSFVAWVGALIKTAQIGRWGWFIGILLTSGLGVLIWSFAGPEVPTAPLMAQSYPGPQQPQQMPYR